MFSPCDSVEVVPSSFVTKFCIFEIIDSSFAIPAPQPPWQVPLGSAIQYESSAEPLQVCALPQEPHVYLYFVTL